MQTLGVRIRHPVARTSNGLLSEMGQHPDLGLMCRAAMWRAALPTALCVGTFTCAVALIDACLRVNTQPGRLVRTRHVPRRATEFPTIQSCNVLASVDTYTTCTRRAREMMKSPIANKRNAGTRNIHPY